MSSRVVLAVPSEEELQSFGDDGAAARNDLVGPVEGGLRKLAQSCGEIGDGEGVVGVDLMLAIPGEYSRERAVVES